MLIWHNWFTLVKKLRPAFSRNRTFLWFVVCLAGISIRSDLMGVTSIVRSIGLRSITTGFLIFFILRRYARIILHVYGQK